MNNIEKGKLGEEIAAKYIVSKGGKIIERNYKIKIGEVDLIGFPYIADKSSWPFAEDVMFWDEWPVAQPALLFSICNTSNRTYLEIWKSLEHFPTNDEVIRNLPIRHPLLWL